MSIKIQNLIILALFQEKQILGCYTDSVDSDTVITETLNHKLFMYVAIIRGTTQAWRGIKVIIKKEKHTIDGEALSSLLLALRSRSYSLLQKHF